MADFDLDTPLADFIHALISAGECAAGFELPAGLMPGFPGVLVMCVSGDEVPKVRRLLRSELGYNFPEPARPTPD